MDMLFLSLKTLHIVAVIAWMAGLLYLPRLFVYRAAADDQISRDRFKIMAIEISFLPSLVSTNSSSAFSIF